MDLIDERGRALVHSLLRAPETIAEICNEAPHSAKAAEELIALVWLLSGAVITLEHELAFRAPADRDCACDSTDGDDELCEDAVRYGAGAVH